MRKGKTFSHPFHRVNQVATVSLRKHMIEQKGYKIVEEKYGIYKNVCCFWEKNLQRELNSCFVVVNKSIQKVELSRMKRKHKHMPSQAQMNFQLFP